MPVQSEVYPFVNPHQTRRISFMMRANVRGSHNVLGEMSKLFPDNVFNISSDETSAKEVAQDDVFSLEHNVLNAIEEDLTKYQWDGKKFCSMRVRLRMIRL